MAEFIDYTSTWTDFRRLLARGKGVDLETFDGLAIKDSKALFNETRKSVVVSIHDTEQLILRHAQTSRIRIICPTLGEELRQVLRKYARGQVPGLEDFAIRETKEHRMQSGIDCAMQGLAQEFGSMWEKIGWQPTAADLTPYIGATDIQIRQSSVYPQGLVLSAETAEWFELHLTETIFASLVNHFFTGDTLIIKDRDGETGKYRHWAEIHLKRFPYDPGR